MKLFMLSQKMVISFFLKEFQGNAVCSLLVNNFVQFHVLFHLPFFSVEKGFGKVIVTEVAFLILEIRVFPDVIQGMQFIYSMELWIHPWGKASFLISHYRSSMLTHFECHKKMFLE